MARIHFTRETHDNTVFGNKLADDVTPDSTLNQVLQLIFAALHA